MALFRTKEAAATELPMCFYGHPALTKPSRDVAVVNEDIELLAARMVLTMEAHEGIGLAAPQIGRNIRLIVIDIPAPDGSDDGPPYSNSPGELMLLPRMPMVLVNPKLSEFSEQMSDYTEGCLSIPGVRASITRPEFVQLQATCLDGQRLNFRCGGLLARCLQHECDHLEGVLFLEHAAPAALEPFAEKLQQLAQQTAAKLKRQRR